MEGVVWGVVVGFFLGSFGYILTRFIVSPVFRYRKIKKHLRVDLKAAEMSAEKDTLNRTDLARIDGFRGHAKAIIHHVDMVLPLWFRLSLERQDERPMDAAAELMTLANIRNPEHLKKRIAAVRNYLHLER
ncbi:hypothetical protein OOT00_02045 [Desulfobotulus sp. H1]|uniref:Uncharacterized protein n=1 Tax=Desulfobotulus pelophilus TaxID=2823377 RepID=A0ABT3N5N2_9BACT|nr:hypothetical protein [Desulfobotulus pelophilus]MCW7752765.1 hypothetical protein [Desulfobotulus pelophilus]